MASTTHLLRDGENISCVVSISKMCARAPMIVTASSHRTSEVMSGAFVLSGATEKVLMQEMKLFSMVPSPATTPASSSSFSWDPVPPKATATEVPGDRQSRDTPWFCESQNRLIQRAVDAKVVKIESGGMPCATPGKRFKTGSTPDEGFMFRDLSEEDLDVVPGTPEVFKRH